MCKGAWVRRTVALATCWLVCGLATADEFLLADAKSWPGTLQLSRDGQLQTLLVRGAGHAIETYPRVHSVTRLRDGRVVFCSGLDRALMLWTPGGEQVLKHGGYLARKVRTGSDGLLYWSGLETPQDQNPLPDGFIYSWNPATDETRTVLTFSQGDVGHDWWGDFDVVDGRVIVGTLRNATSLYDVTATPVRRLCTLPLAVTSFRFAPDASLWACDGHGRLLRFADLAQPEVFEEKLHSPLPFEDFEFGPGR